MKLRGRAGLWIVRELRCSIAGYEIDEPLQRNSATEFKVFVGNRGDRTGTFFAVDDEFLPEGDYAVAVLHYKTAEGRGKTARFELRSRC